MKHTVLALAFGALVISTFSIGCAASSTAADDNVDATENAIQGGSTDTSDPAVGMLSNADGFCSATLIAPDVVLTAGHCIEQMTGFYTTPKGSTKPTVLHAISDQVTHPSYRASGCPNPTLDIGLVHLSAPITNITPKSFGTTAPAAGATCSAIGFGQHDSASGVQSIERKRSATETVVSVASTSILVTTGSGIADHGDSGGPLVCGDTIVGTVSCHTDGDIPEHTHEYYGRITPQVKTWIESQMHTWGSGS